MKKIQAKYIYESDKCWTDQRDGDGMLMIMDNKEADNYVNDFKSAFGDLLVRAIDIKGETT